MIASPPKKQRGYVRAELTTSTLREFLRGDRSFDSALASGNNGRNRRTPYTQVQRDTLVGFIAHPNYPDEVVVAKFPFAGQIVPVVSLRAGDQDWEPALELVQQERLLCCEGVILKANWLTHLVNLATTLKRPNIQESGVDKTLLAIGAAWERWERDGMTWSQRGRDLARLTGLRELGENTLMQTCKRRGLVRGDKSPHLTSETRR